LLVSGMGVGGTGTQTGGVTEAQLAEALRRQALQDANKAAALEASAERAAAAAARAAAAAAAAAAGASYNGNGNGNGVGGNGANGGTPWVPSVGIPDNFFGFLMLTLGMR